jgi:selenocysteine lyase/cysteine desulfurase
MRRERRGRAVNGKAHFRRFFAADPDRLHVAAHSHHPWPDVTYDAQVRCWDDAARMADRKWAHLFADTWPALQQRIAEILGLPDPATLTFGPNTHGFLMRLLSCLPGGRPARILSTDGEFHSFSRQMRRLEEAGQVRLHQVPVEPLAGFSERFAKAAAHGDTDLVYVSHVFFDSGFAVPDLTALVEAVKASDALIVIDGYHGFMAVPTDLAAIAGRAFYLAGGYKYAMAGEGAVFLHAPPGLGPRPRDTGWYAAFAALEDSATGQVAYATDGSRFLGATFDPVGLYRLRAVLDWLDQAGITVAMIHAHVQALQHRFAAGLEKLKLPALNPEQLVVPLTIVERGHFLTFRTAEAGAIHRRLLAAHVITDYRGDRLRFGFGLYHDEADVDRLCRTVAEVLA